MGTTLLNSSSLLFCAVLVSFIDDTTAASWGWSFSENIKGNPKPQKSSILVKWYCSKGHPNHGRRVTDDASEILTTMLDMHGKPAKCDFQDPNSPVCGISWKPKNFGVSQTVAAASAAATPPITILDLAERLKASLGPFPWNLGSPPPDQVPKSSTKDDPSDF